MNEQSVWPLKTGLSVPCSLCTAAPSPQKKIGEGVSVEEGETVHRLVSDGWCISSSSEKRANNKIPVSSVFNDSEGLYGTTVCRCLVRGPNYSARLMRFGSSGPSEFATVRRRRTGTMHNVYLASEKNREILFIGNVFYKQWHLCVLFH